MDGRVQSGRRIEVHHPAVHSGPHEPAGAKRFEDLVVLALAPPDERSEQHESLAGRPRKHRVDHLAHGLRFEHQTVLEAARLPDAGEQKTQVIVDFGHRADRRSRVAGPDSLLDGDGGGESLDVVDVRLLHHREELARVGGKGLDVATLPLRVDGVEGEGRLAGARETRDHHEPIAGNVDVDIPEVVGPRTTDADRARPGATDRREKLYAAHVPGRLRPSEQV